MGLYDRFNRSLGGLSVRAQPPALVGSGVAVSLVGLSALVGLWFRPATYHSPYLFFYAAILISLIYGGFRPGLASTFLSALLVNYLFQPPYGQFSYDLSSLARGSYFCLSFGFICWLVDTRRKASEGQIQTQRQLLDLAAAPVIMCDEEDRITYWSEGAEAVYGWNGQEAMGQHITELLHTVLPEPIQDIKSQLTSVGQWSGELKRTRKDGSAAIVASSWTLRRTGHHGLTRLEADHDLTKQRKAEEQLRGSEDQFRTMANAMPQLAWMANPDGWIFWYNQGWYDYTGTTPQQMEGWGWQSVHDPAELPKVMERWQASIATSEPFEMVFPLRSVRGEFRAFLTRVSPIKDASGEVLRWFGTDTDVDEQKRTEKALIESQQRLAGIVGSAMDSIITVDERQRIVVFNAAAERMFRCTETEALGEPIERFIPQRFRAAHAGHLRDFGETNVTNRSMGALGELWALRADGEELPIEASISSVEHRGKKLFTVILRDISERKLVEDNLRKSEDRYRDLVENSQDLIYTHDLEGKLLSANQAPARVLGYEVAELLNIPMREIIAPEFREQFDQYLVRLKNHGADKGLMAVLTRTGERRIWEYDNTLRTEGVPAPIVRGMAHDVTERMRAEQKLAAQTVRLKILAKASKAFAEVGQDYQAALDQVARQVANTMADICLVRMLSAEGESLNLVAQHGLNAEQSKAVREQVYKLSDWEGSPDPVLKVLRSGEPVLVPVITADQMRNKLSASARSIHEKFLPHSYIIVPLRAEGRQIGILSLIRHRSEKTAFTEEDVILAQDLADRAVLAITNAGLLVKVRHELEERARAEEKVRESEARLNEAQHNAHIGSWQYIPDDTFIWSDELYEMFKLPRDVPVTYEAIFSVIHPEDRDGERNRVVQAMGPGSDAVDFMGEYRIVWPDGQIRWISSLGKVRRDDQGRVLEAVGTIQDVTERKQADADLKEREEQLRLFVEYAPAALAMFDREMRYLSVSRRWLADYGLGDRDLRGVSHYEVFPELPERWKAAHRRGLAGEVLREDDDRFERADGAVQSVAWEVRPWHDPRGGIGGVVIFTEDITQRKQVQETLRISEERLRLAVRVTAMGIWELRFPTRTLIWAPEVRDIFGVPADAPQPSFEDAARFTHPEDRSLVEEQFDLLLDGKPIQLDHRIIRPDGKVRWIEVTGKAEFDDTGQPGRCFGVIRDVTERHHLEAQFRQAQKMEAVGRLSGGVAHDFNNILMIIIGYTDLLKDRPGSDERLGPMIEAILKAANRAASLTHQLLAFSRKQILMPKVLDLNSVVADLGKMLPRLIGEDIELEIVPGSGLGRVMADASQIQQVVMNLVVNARDAMPEGGRLTIATANAEWDEKSGLEFGIEAKPGSFVSLTVADNGIGMDQEIRAHLFEPFFTTKGVDKGTGLGLSIVYGVVKQSGGFIRVDSEPGQGTTFKLYLPRIEAEETITSASNVPPKSRRGSETILLVEDEPGVREAIAHFLRDQGYTVLEAHDPSAALEIAQEQSKPIHVLITDIIMPEMNGQELAKQLTATRPEMGVLYITGYTDRGMTGGTTIDANMNFLLKPFGFDVLGRKLRDILER